MLSRLATAAHYFSVVVSTHIYFLVYASQLPGNDSRVVIWNLCSGEMIQEVCIPSAGFISCLAWIKLSEPEDAFVFGASDGGIHLYERRKDESLFTFRSITLAHGGAIESFAWDPVRSRLASAGSGQVQLWKLGPEASTCYISLFCPLYLQFRIICVADPQPRETTLYSSFCSFL